MKTDHKETSHKIIMDYHLITHSRAKEYIKNGCKVYVKSRKFRPAKQVKTGKLYFVKFVKMEE